MSLHDYRVAMDIAMCDHPFYALIMAAMVKADNTNRYLLRYAFPDIWDEYRARCNAPGGVLPEGVARVAPEAST